MRGLRWFAPLVAVLAFAALASPAFASARALKGQRAGAACSFTLSATMAAGQSGTIASTVHSVNLANCTASVEQAPAGATAPAFGTDATPANAGDDGTLGASSPAAPAACVNWATRSRFTSPGGVNQFGATDYVHGCSNGFTMNLAQSRCFLGQFQIFATRLWGLTRRGVSRCLGSSSRVVGQTNGWQVRSPRFAYYCDRTPEIVTLNHRTIVFVNLRARDTVRFVVNGPCGFRIFHDFAHF